MKTASSPIVIKHRGFQARIYDRNPTRSCYRVSWQAGGKQITRERTELSDAKKLANDALRDLAKGQTHLTEKQVNDYKCAQNTLREVGVPLVDAVIEYCHAKTLMPNIPLRTAAEAWRDNSDNVKRAAFGKVAQQFLANQKSRTSPRTHYDETLRVNRLCRAFQMDLCDLSKSALELFFSDELGGLKGKSRNHYRQTLRQLFKYAVRRDCLNKDHRLFEVLENEPTNERAPKILSAAEFKKLLNAASPELLPLIALGAFAGLRRAETLRLTWEDVRRCKGDQQTPHGYIEVAPEKAKTKQRRLVPILPCLAALLAPYKRKKGSVWTGSDHQQKHDFEMLKKKCDITGQNLLRHSYASYRLADVKNSAQVALELGTGESKLFQNYNKLVAPAQAKQWFSILPEEPANVISAAS